MKTKMISTMLVASLFTLTAHAGSFLKADCTLMGAPQGGDASSVQKVQFGPAAENAVGTPERKATLGDVTATLGEAAGQTAYVNIQDGQGKIYFAAAFDGMATYATSKYTIQISCK